MDYLGIADILLLLPFLVSLLAYLPEGEWIVNEKMGQLMLDGEREQAAKDICSMIGEFANVFKLVRFSAVYSNLAIISTVPAAVESARAMKIDLFPRFMWLALFLLIYNAILALLSRRIHNDYRKIHLGNFHNKYIFVSGRIYLRIFGTVLTIFPAAVTVVTKVLLTRGPSR